MSRKRSGLLETIAFVPPVGIERLMNLLTLDYTIVKILLCISQELHALKGLSHQEARFVLGRSIRKEVFFAAFVRRVVKLNNPDEFVKLLKTHFQDMVATA